MQQNDEGSEPPVHGTKLLRKFVAENHSNSLMKNDVEYSSVLKRNKQKILRSMKSRVKVASLKTNYPSKLSY